MGLIAVAVAVGIAVIGILQRRSHEAEVTQWTQEQAVPTVAVISPETGPRRSVSVLPGTVQAWYEAPIYARVTGYLKNWYFDYGAHVKKGDVLAEIETPDLMRNWRDAGQAQFGASAGEGQGGRKAIRGNQPIIAGATRRKASFPCKSRKASRPTTTAPSPALNAATAEVAADQGDVDRL